MNKKIGYTSLTLSLVVSNACWSEWVIILKQSDPPTSNPKILVLSSKFLLCGNFFWLFMYSLEN